MRRINLTRVLVSLCIVLMAIGSINYTAYSGSIIDNQTTTNDTVNGIDIVNGSTSTPPEDYVPVPAAPSGNTPMAMAASAASQSGGFKTLLVEDVLPWSYPSSEHALSELGIAYDVIGSGSLTSTDLSRYGMVIIASDQQTWTYNNLASNKEKLASYVYDGGILVAHATDEGWNNGYWGSSFLPMGVTHVNNPNEYLSIVDSSSPIVSGITDAELYGWYYSAHGYFTNIPADAHIIIGLTGNPAGYPTYMEYSYGSGKVLATMETIEWPWKRVADGDASFIEQKNLLRNEFQYASGLSGTDKAWEYAPNLWFDSKENYYPTSPFFYATNIEETSGEKSKNDYLNLSFSQKMDDFTVYYHTVDVGSETVYEYWLYYTYNDFVNKHYHDWEKVYVFVNKDTGSVNRVIASAHEWYIQNNILNNPINDHTGILVEAGSHASITDKNDDGNHDRFTDISNIPEAYGFWGFDNPLIPLLTDYLWSKGARVAYDNPHYKLVNITDSFIEQFNGEKSFPNSPSKGTFYVEVPVIGGKYILPLGGSPPEHPWFQKEYSDPFAMISPYEYCVSGLVISMDGTSIPGAVAVVLSNETYYTFTNESGYFFILNVNPEIHEIIINADGYSPYKQRFIHEGNTSLGVNDTLYLVPVSDAFRIEGIVRDAKGNAIVNSSINVYDENNNKLFTTLTDENGSYLITASVKHNYTVEAVYGNRTGTIYNVSGNVGSTVVANIIAAYPAIWANSTTSGCYAIKLSGSDNKISGRVHSNDGIKISGSSNTINDTTTYASDIDVHGNRNVYMYPPFKTPAEPYPVYYNIEDYRPGGPKALSAQAQGKYHLIDGDYHLSNSGEILDGLYYVMGNAYISGSRIGGTFTIVSEGDIIVSGSNLNCTAYSDDVLFFSCEGLKISGSKSMFGGIMYTPYGGIDVSGSGARIEGGLLGETIKLSGSKMRIKAI